MITTIEKDSPVIPLLILAFVCLILVGGVLGLAYIGGVFTGKNDVIANDRRIASLTPPISTPPAAPGTTKP